MYLQTKKINKALSVLLAGRPNVGKSTLFNQLLGNKVSATSNKVNTTITPKYGGVIYNQCFYNIIDLPGTIDTNTFIHADLILLILEDNIWTKIEENIVQLYKNSILIAIINKMDKLKFYFKKSANPFVLFLNEKAIFKNILYISSKHRHGINDILNTIERFTHNMELHQVSLENNVFSVKEFIREQIFRYTNQEVPYCTDVDIVKHDQNLKIYIYVNKKSLIPILVGKNGKFIKFLTCLVKKHTHDNFSITIKLKK